MKIIVDHLPTKEETENEALKHFKKAKGSKNALSYWFPRIINCGIKVPETIIIALTYEQYKWLISDNYRKDDIETFNKQITSALIDSGFDVERPMFIKTGNFSNKFDFTTCKLTDVSRIGEQFLAIYYGALCVGAEDAAELVVREYISPKHDRPTIYRGMPLNTEFRVFYDFDKRSVLGCFNYWDRATMQKNLWNKEDLEKFNTTIDELESEYNSCKDYVIERVSRAMLNVDLSGQWSIDIMKCGDDYYLIDMALAQNSYYFNLLSKAENNSNH